MSIHELNYTNIQIEGNQSNQVNQVNPAYQG